MPQIADNSPNTVDTSTSRSNTLESRLVKDYKGHSYDELPPEVLYFIFIALLNSFSNDAIGRAGQVWQLVRVSQKWRGVILDVEKHGTITLTEVWPLPPLSLGRQMQQTLLQVSSNEIISPAVAADALANAIRLINPEAITTINMKSFLENASLLFEIYFSDVHHDFLSKLINFLRPQTPDDFLHLSRYVILFLPQSDPGVYQTAIANLTHNLAADFVKQKQYFNDFWLDAMEKLKNIFGEEFTQYISTALSHNDVLNNKPKLFENIIALIKTYPIPQESNPHQFRPEDMEYLLSFYEKLLSMYNNLDAKKNADIALAKWQEIVLLLQTNNLVLHYATSTRYFAETFCFKNVEATLACMRLFLTHFQNSGVDGIKHRDQLHYLTIIAEEVCTKIFTVNGNNFTVDDEQNVADFIKRLSFLGNDKTIQNKSTYWFGRYEDYCKSKPSKIARKCETQVDNPSQISCADSADATLLLDMTNSDSGASRTPECDHFVGKENQKNPLFRPGSPLAYLARFISAPS